MSPSDFPGVQLYRVNGDSMAPEFQDGDTIHVDPDGEPTADKPSYVLAEVAGILTFRAYVAEDGRVMLKAVNKDARSVDITDRDDVQILGKVIHRGRTVPHGGNQITGGAK